MENYLHSTEPQNAGALTRLVPDQVTVNYPLNGTYMPLVTPSAANSPNAPDPAFPVLDKPKQERTPGLKLLDLFIYPGINNAAVFGISVFATYLTSKGGMRNKEGELIYGKTGEFFQQRGEWLKKEFNKMGMTDEQADMSKMVAFSFIDGSAMAPVIKVFEDHREGIGRKIDEALGTKPDDDSVYRAEPKQSWKSVLLGRALTAGIVVPTAVALDKQGLNKILFNDPGEKIGMILEKKPYFQKHAGWLDIKEVSRVSVFEAFYTSVCTAGLYFSSRFLAGIPGIGGTHEAELVPANSPYPPSRMNQHSSYSAAMEAPTIQHAEAKADAPAMVVNAHEAHAQKMNTAEMARA